MKTKNENNVYQFVCAVTGKTVATNPKQFFATAKRAGVEDAVLKTSYISREGRNIIKAAGLTAEQVVAQYGVDATYAASLKNLAKAPVVAAPVDNIAVAVAPEAIDTAIAMADKVVEQVLAEAAPAPAEVFYDATKDDELVTA